LFLLYYR